MNNYTNRDSDIAKAKLHAALSIEKLPALNESIKFILDVCYGRRTEISTKTIDDAFDYVDNRDKSIIYLSDLPYDEKEKAIHQAELNIETRKQMLKSFLDFMSVKYKNNNQENNNSIKLINYE